MQTIIEIENKILKLIPCQVHCKCLVFGRLLVYTGKDLLLSRRRTEERNHYFASRNVVGGPVQSSVLS